MICLTITPHYSLAYISCKVLHFNLVILYLLLPSFLAPPFLIPPFLSPPLYPSYLPSISCSSFLFSSLFSFFYPSLCPFLLPRWLTYINPNYYGFSSSAFLLLSDFNSTCLGSQFECYTQSGPYVLSQFGFDNINPYLHITMSKGEVRLAGLVYIVMV